MTSDNLGGIEAAKRCATGAWRDRYSYTKVGILLDDLTGTELRPRTLPRSVIISQR